MHIRKRGKNTFQCIIKIGDKSFAKTFKNIRECRQWGYQYELQKNKSLNYLKYKNTTLNELLDNYLKDFVPFLKDKGIKNQINRIKKNYGWLINKKLDELRPIDFLKFKTVRIKDIGNHNSFRNNFRAANKDLALFKCIFNKAKYFWSINVDNPLNLIKRFPESKGKYRPITSVEHRMILRNCSTIKKAIILLLRHTGARPIEVFSLKWENLNEQRSEIYISWEVSKSAYSRMISVRPFLIKWLKKNLDITSNKVIKFNKSFRVWLSKLTKKCDFKNFTMYDYRRNFIRYNANKNMPLPKLALMTGHRSYDMLARYYGHFILRQGREI